MAKHFTTMTFQNYLLSAYYVLALSPDARLERTAKKTGITHKWVCVRHRELQGSLLVRHHLSSPSFSTAPDTQ